jgi:hypothetical protein
MNGHVDQMQGNMSMMKTDVVSINSNMTSMSGRFDHVNVIVDKIGYDVQQMSKTIP